jgi:putative transposase
VLELRQKGNLAQLLRIASMARSTFYYHIASNPAADRYEVVKRRIVQLYQRHKGLLGYRRILLALRSKGFKINHKTVLKLMQQLRLKSIIRRKKYQSYKGEIGKTAPNLLQRKFKADRPMQKLATDITEFKVKDQKLYLSAVIDLFNGEIISYKLSDRPNFDQITQMLNSTIRRLAGDSKPILHSDQGWQYQMKQYRKILHENNIIPSMSRKGNCLDNAIIENFFGTIKAEMFYLKKYQSIQELAVDIKEYIHYYNHTRIRINLKGKSPVQYRAQYLKN